MSKPDKAKLKDAAIKDIRLVEDILRQWDPIGVEPGALAPADEYDSYAPHIASMVKSNCTVETLAAHLEHLGTETMGLGRSNESSRAHSLKFATKILAALRPPNGGLKCDAAKPRTLN
ncbi:hypothetical protein GCM10027285_29420 [Oleiagrimonas citrea]|uniref:Uncharacterized protein n=1 Tax=Oleiagrimonas citrea TaxID=1665687 RepID=A0A846ZLS0_9GAMM|nr:hypothetical protein [Oleiagrimonas citrea]NKZ39275.1 hypothetical protein [Oleiagrimonas citrea]